MKRLVLPVLAACGLLTTGCIMSTNNNGGSNNPNGTNDGGADGGSADGDGGSSGRPPRDTVATRSGDPRTKAQVITANLPPKTDWDDGIAKPGTSTQPVEVSSFTPTTGGAGTAVEIFGANFGDDPTKVKVTVGGVEWTVTEIFADRIVVTVPDGAKDGNIKVAVGSKSATTDGEFTFLADDGGFGTATGMNGLQGEVFNIGSQFTEMPDFGALGEPHAIIAVPNLDVPTRDFTSGFPGVDGNVVEYFAIRFTGSLNITEEAEYNLCLNSDDGSKLLLEGTEVVNNDGTHATKEECSLVYLAAGEYQLEVQYFQGPRTEIALQFMWQQDGGDKVAVPESALFRPQ